MKIGDKVLYENTFYQIEHAYGDNVFRIGNAESFCDMVPLQLLQAVDAEPCKMKNVHGSESGSCECTNPKQCPNPRKFSPIGMRVNMMLDQWMAKYA